jgi:type IV secretory pathway VirB10-like protein
MLGVPMKFSHLTFALLIGTSGIVLAQDAPPPPPQQGNTKTPVINQRERNQRGRIRQGVKTGNLTPAEAAKLRKEERQIQADKQAAKADGNVTPAERRKIKQEENNASKDIYKKKHNAAVRKGSEAAKPE